MSKFSLPTIFFGVILQDADGTRKKTPWEKAGFKCEVEYWARLNGFEPAVEIYDDWGVFRGGKHPGREVFDRYFEHRRDFIRLHLPKFSSFALGDHMEGFTALCANFTCVKFGENTDSKFNPEELVISAEDAAAFKQQLLKMGIEIEPRWHCVTLG